MSKLKRLYHEGQIYFVTNVTHNRQPYLEDNYDLRWKAISNTKNHIEFNLIAYIFLPDHVHLLIDPGLNNLSDILHRIKLSFGAMYRKRYGLGRGRIWQSRFWDHVIRNQDDMNVRINYIHYNPVKHGYAKDPFTYRHSSIHEYFQEGYYSKDWGCREPVFNGDFGDD